jgi:hypothetical protein
MTNTTQMAGGAVCKGSLQFGSGCGSCPSCKDEIKSMLGQIKSAARRYDDLAAQFDVVNAASKDKGAKLEAAEAELAAMRRAPVVDAGVVRDANRYRFLRDGDSWGWDSDSWDPDTRTGLISSAKLITLENGSFDAAIDARMAASDIQFFDPVEPVVVLPEGSRPSVVRGGQQSTSYRAIMSAKGDWIHRESITKVLKDAGITVKSADYLARANIEL